MTSFASHPNVMLIDSHTVRMHHLSPVPGKKKHLDIDLSKLWLPATELTPVISSISNRPEYVDIIHESIFAYIDRNGYGEKTPYVISGMVLTQARFFEYLWLKGCFHITDCTPGHIEQMLKPLAEGGWTKVLEIDQRVRRYLSNLPQEEIRKYLSKSKRAMGDGGRHLVLANRLFGELGTNISGVGRSGVSQIVIEMAGLQSATATVARSRRPSVSHIGSSAGSLMTDFKTLNMMAHGIGVPVLQFVPFPNALKLSRKLGRPPGRTKSMKPQEVGALLKKSFWSIDVLGPVVADVLDTYLASVTKRKNDAGNISAHSSQTAFRDAIQKSGLEEIVGGSVGPTIRKCQDESGFGNHVRGVLSAAFIVIAVLNGRRRGEIESPVYGLRENSLRLVDEGLSIYECHFYIEKTIRDYVWFYVGDATVRAIRLLERLSAIARALLKVLHPNSSHQVELDRLRSLFQIPTTLIKGGHVPQWFTFGARGNHFSCSDASGSEVKVAAHMFRRAYALVFFYRYEDGDLLALKQQLGHFDIEMTRAYVTWAAQRVMGATLSDYGKISAKQRIGLASDAQEILTELDAVSKERVREFIDEVLKGSSRLTGGFTKLIQRFHQRWSGRIEYRLKSQVDQAVALTTFVIERGHYVTPFPHGNCVASEKKRNSAAGCYSGEQKGLQRENAGPHVCSKCPYHVLGATHLSSLREEARAREGEMNAIDANTVMGKRLRKEQDNLVRLIDLYGARLTDLKH